MAFDNLILAGVKLVRDNTPRFGKFDPQTMKIQESIDKPPPLWVVFRFVSGFLVFLRKCTWEYT